MIPSRKLGSPSLHVAEDSKTAHPTLCDLVDERLTRQILITTGKPVKDNAIFCGDCHQVMNERHTFPDEFVDLIYVDPPFGSGEDYEIVFKDGVEVRHFKDRWIGGKQSYLDWIHPRILECWRVLKQTGSFYLHCDYHLNAYLRKLCDDVFGEGNFRNEVIWKRKDAQSCANRYGTVNDTILFYTKSDTYTFNKVYTPLPEKTKRNWYRNEEVALEDTVNRLGMPIAKGTKRFYNKADVTASGDRAGTRAHYQWRGKLPANGSHWRYTQDVMEKMEAEGRILHSKSGHPYEKRYLDESKGVPLQSIWDDIPMLRGIQKHQKDAEYEGFPTQKPVDLLKRIVESSSNRNDLVLDPMCGCGTTLEAAQLLGRRWIGIDISPTACRLMAKRLRNMGYPASEDEIIGLPRSLEDIKNVVKLDSIEFQNWVCDKLHAVSTTPRGQGPRPDKNIDGWIMGAIPIQVKGSDGIGYGEVERFAQSMKKRGRKEGYIIAFSFAPSAYEEAVRVKREEELFIDLIELKEETIPNPKYPEHPEVNTILYSKLTKRKWGRSASNDTQ